MAGETEKRMASVAGEKKLRGLGCECGCGVCAAAMAGGGGAGSRHLQARIMEILSSRRRLLKDVDVECALLPWLEVVGL